MRIRIDGTRASAEDLKGISEAWSLMTSLQREARTPPTITVAGAVEDVMHSWVYLESSMDDQEDDFDAYVSGRTTLGIEDLSNVSRGETVTIEGPLVDLYSYEMESGRMRFSITIAPAELTT